MPRQDCLASLPSLKLRGAQNQAGDHCQVYVSDRAIRLGWHYLRIVEALLQRFNRGCSRLASEEKLYSAIENLF
jgi:hypothetical protein